MATYSCGTVEYTPNPFADTPYANGVQAFFDGKDYTHNPFDTGSDEHNEWRFGYVTTKRAFTDCA